MPNPFQPPISIILTTEGFAQSHGISFASWDEVQNTEYYCIEVTRKNCRHSPVAFVSAGHSSAKNLLRSSLVSEQAEGGLEKSILLRKGDCADSEVKEDSQRAEQRAKAHDSKRSVGDIPEPSSLQRQMASMHLTATSQPPFDTFEEEESMISRPSMASSPAKVHNAENLDDQIIFADIRNSQQFGSTEFPPPAIRTPPIANSDINEEEIIFTGRKASARPSKESHSQWEPRLSHGAASVAEKTRYHDTVDIFPSADVHPALAQSTALHSTNRADSFIPLMSPKRRKAHGGFKHSKPGAEQKQGKRIKRKDEIMEDYMANILAGENRDGNDTMFSTNEYDTDTLDGWRGKEENSTPDLTGHESGDSWTSGVIRDFDEFSTSSERFEVINKVLAKRERSSGIQYLVIGDGLSIDEARWLPHDSLSTLDDAANLFSKFDHEEAGIEHLLEGTRFDDSLNDEAQIETDVQEALDDLEADKGSKGRDRICITDEQIAMLLTEQKVLDMGSGDLVPYHGIAGLRPIGTQSDPLHMTTSSRKVRPLDEKRISQGFPSATAFAQALEEDPYMGFDIMDHERPSLRKKPKGRRGKLNVELSDSEFELKLQTARKNDRSKKNARKREREELRLQGLLGIKNKTKSNPGSKARHTDGMSILQIRDEIKQFMASSATELALPAMDAGARKDVHQMCFQLALNTKSRGSGNSRYPVVYRTSRTKGFDEAVFASVYQNFRPRSGKFKKRVASITGGRGGTLAAASYQDGEIVGAAAPELGQENRGRAMLEKMGWSTGTALGASNNKGISVPVAQIVRTTRAGLG